MNCKKVCLIANMPFCSVSAWLNWNTNLAFRSDRSKYNNVIQLFSDYGFKNLDDACTIVIT